MSPLLLCDQTHGLRYTAWKASVEHREGLSRWTKVVVDE